MPRSLFIHIVTYGHAKTIAAVLKPLLELEGFRTGENLTILVTDNASRDASADIVETEFAGRVMLTRNVHNLGFCGGHNQGVGAFLAGGADYYLMLNPDLRLERNAPLRMVEALEQHPEAAMCCARLYRADASLNPVEPRRLDSAGMHLTRSLRHFDRGSEAPDVSFEKDEWVFGGTGACLMLRRAAVQDLLLPETPYDERLFDIYPQLGRAVRKQLFDEAFFAYREDADLAWRAQLRGWRCRYVASAIGYHVRVVLPERRAILPPIVNKLGVRNRFLLQLNNAFPAWTVDCAWALFIGGFLRNLFVMAVVLCKETSSLGALREIWCLLPRARYIRRYLRDRRGKHWESTWEWCSRV